MESVSRRDLAKTFAFGLAAAAVPTALKGQSAPTRNLKIGCATLAWNVSPRALDNFETAVKDISELGYWGFETVSGMIEALDDNNTLAKLIEKYALPMKAGYIDVNLTDTTARKEQVERVIRLGKLIKKYGGTYAVVSANGRRPRAPAGGPGNPPQQAQRPPDTFHFMEHKANMVAALNEYGAAITDLGLGCGLHQHTGSVVETRDEVYGIMEAVNHKVIKFAPDVGQIQKGGADAAQVVKDFASITNHMHLKDYSNGKYMGGYCPLGMGVVDLVSILNTMESNGLNADIIHELDRGPDTPMTARETAAFSKAYLMRIGYKFRG